MAACVAFRCANSLETPVEGEGEEVVVWIAELVRDEGVGVLPFEQKVGSDAPAGREFGTEEVGGPRGVVTGRNSEFVGESLSKAARQMPGAAL